MCNATDYRPYVPVSGAVCFCIGFGVVLHYSVFQRISVVSQRYFIVSQYNREIHVFHVSQ